MHKFPSGTSSEAMRLILLCEIVSGTDFVRDRLYVDYRIEFDPHIWKIQNQTDKKEDENAGYIQVNGQTQIFRRIHVEHSNMAYKKYKLLRFHSKIRIIHMLRFSAHIYT